jgi:hypothetical protein
MGTLINAVAIVGGGLVGLAVGTRFTQRYQETVIKALGLAVLAMALGSMLTSMLTVTVAADASSTSGFAATLDTQGVLMMIVSLAAGALLGEAANLDGRLEQFGQWLKRVTHSEGDSTFIEGFVTTSLTVCVGAMAIVGAIQDGTQGNYQTLLAKSLLDAVLVMAMTAALGKGCIFSVIPVVLLQGGVTLLAQLIAPVLTQGMLTNLSYVGNVLILGVGINLLWPRTVRVANLLPALIIAVIFALF